MSQAKQLKVGVIGAGFIASTAHLPSILLSLIHIWGW